MIQSPPARVLVFTHFFAPETGAGSHRTSSVVEGLAGAGHEVNVVTPFPSWPTGVRPARYQGRLFVRDLLTSAEVNRVWAFASPHFTPLNRLLAMLTSALSALSYLLLARPRYDVVYVSSPPITLALPALAAVLLGRVPLVVDVRDVYPEVAVRLGEWRPDAWITRTVGRVADLLYARAATIITVTETCRADIAARGVDPAKIVVVPNGFDAVQPSPRAPYTKRRDEFTVSYTGNLGLASGVGLVAEAAKILADDRRIRFVVVGDGAQRAEIAAKLGQERVYNVTMLGALSRSDAFAVQRLSDLCIIPLRRNLLDSLPTKLIDALALGRPVIVCAYGEARRFVEEADAGIAVEPENPGALAEAIASLVGDAERLAMFARNGPAYVAGRFDRRSLSRKIVARIAELA